MPEIKAVESLLKALTKRARGMTEEQKLAWLHGFAYGDASVYLVKSEVTLTTPRIDTMLAFVTIAIEFSKVIRVYPGRKRSDAMAWYVHAEVPLELVQSIHRAKMMDLSIVSPYLENRELLKSLTAGLMYSDGSVTINVKRRKRGKTYRYFIEPEGIDNEL